MELTADQAILQAVEGLPTAGPSSTPAHGPARRNYHKKHKKIEGLTSYTLAFVPGVYNIKNPAGDYVQRDSNVEVARQVSQAKARTEKQAVEEERQRLAQEGATPDHSLAHTLVIHPGSRNLRIGRASDFYPHEVPNCIARPVNAPNRGNDPPVPGSRAKGAVQAAGEARAKKRQRRDDGTDVEINGNEEDAPWENPVDSAIGYLRDYLRNRLRQNKLTTDSSQGARVITSNQKSKPEPIPEHNDPYRIDWTEADGRPYYVGTEALRLPETENSGYRVRYPILHRGLNKRDWRSSQLLLDDIAAILQEALKTELSITQRDYSKYSVILIVPDHGDRVYVEELAKLLLSVMGFKELAVHQEAFTAIFCAGLSSACVVDIGAQQTSVTCVDEGFLNADTRINLDYGGDDITSALTAMLQRSAFPYRGLDLARNQDWLMMDNLKIKICTLEEHLVANTPWDFHVLQPEGLTQKFLLRTYDENILAPLCYFDTRMIDFEEKRGNGTFAFRNPSEDVDDMLWTSYDEPSGAMRACITHVRPVQLATLAVSTEGEGGTAESANGNPQEEAATHPEVIASSRLQLNEDTPQAQEVKPFIPSGTPSPPLRPMSEQSGSVPALRLVPQVMIPDFKKDVVHEAARVPLDAAIAASISLCGTENKIKAAASSILLIGGGAALKGLGAFLGERLPPLLRARALPIPEVQIVPPPRNLNPRFVCWKGASVMCNLDSLSDMWIGRDEWDAIGPRALKERYLFM